MGRAALVAILLLAAASSPSPTAAEWRVVAWADLPPAIRGWLRHERVDADGFDAYVRAIEARSAERRTGGELEQLVYFILQSASFTKQAPIEPALSASAFFRRLSEEERVRLRHDGAYLPPLARLPAEVAERFRAFLSARGRPVADERLAHFGALVPDGAGVPFLYGPYAAAMRFLYEKELAPGARGPAARLYQERGYSTDTGFEANFAVYEALAVLKRIAPGEKLNRILIVGPGLDLAPRTELLEAYPPQS